MTLVCSLNHYKWNEQDPSEQTILVFTIKVVVQTFVLFCISSLMAFFGQFQKEKEKKSNKQA